MTASGHDPANGFTAATTDGNNQVTSAGSRRFRCARNGSPAGSHPDPEKSLSTPRQGLRSDGLVNAPAPLPPRPDLTDGVVLLRQPGVADIPAITRGASEPSVARYTTVPSPYSESDAQWFVDEVHATWQAGTAATFAVCDAQQPDALLGMIGLHNIDRAGDPGGTAEIGYWLSTPARGRGLMRRSVRVLSTWAIDELGLARIDWVAAAGNTSSRNVVAHSGYQYEGFIRLGMMQRGQRIDAWVGGLIAEELIR